MSGLPIYFLILSGVYTLLVFLTYFRSQKMKKETKIALDLGLILMVAGFLGGRLLHVVYEEPQFYSGNPLAIFQFWQGGFVFYGGFITALLGCLVYLKIQKQSFFEWADFFAPIIALGYSLGRWSCFFAGCCYGRACDLPWAVRFEWDQNMVLRHPTQIYASLWELGVFGLLTLFEKKKKNTGMIFSLWLVLHGIGRLMMEYFRDDFRGAFYGGLSISSWISAGVISIGFFFLLAAQKRPLSKF